MLAYKGFNRKLQGYGKFQFQIGSTYIANQSKLRKCGYHSCTNPLIVLLYYPPFISRYCLVDVSGDVKQGLLSCIASTEIKIPKRTEFISVNKTSFNERTEIV